jgi:pSer/pThr/pTyr-binding forkhead associated (FHA) protein
MAVLIVKKNGQPHSQYTIEQDRVYTAGRKLDSDIPLEAEKAISREHLKIRLQNNTLNVECVSKLSNLQVGGTPVLSADLNHGDHFSVGPFEFTFQSVVADTQATPQGSQVISNPEDKTMIQKSALSAYVRLVNSDGDTTQQFKLEGRDRWQAGRDATAEILISDHRVSRKQFEIRKIEQHYEILDLGSVNGTYINERLLEKQSVALKSGDLIRVLDHQMVFEVHDPHFFSKVEKLSPALYEVQQEEPPQQEILYEQPPDYNMQPQLLSTSMGGENPYFDQNQGFQEAAPEEDPSVARTKKIRVVILILAIAGGTVYMMGGDGTSAPSQIPSAQAPPGADPLSSLSAQQKSEYKQSLELAKRYFMEGNYDLSLSEVEELMKNYKVIDPDADKLRNTALAAIETQKQLVRQEKEEKERQIMEAKIKASTQDCKKQIQRFKSVEELDACLLEALQLNPAHVLVMDLKAEFESIQAEREVKRQNQAEINRKIQQMRKLFEEAQKIEKEGDYIATLAAYETVTKSKLPDPDKLKKASADRIKKLKAEMAQKIKKFEQEAQGHEQKKNLKQAVLTLREAIKIDPTRDDLKDKADNIKNDLRKQMMEIYQEGILEESFGNVEGGDNRVGAKEKWKKIVDTDLADGEYYQKAYIKLKKYGEQ